MSTFAGQSLLTETVMATCERRSGYLRWIAEHVTDPHGQCMEITERMAAAFPELRRVRGHYVCPYQGPRPHWWLITPDGTVLDPTKEQFVSQGCHGTYEPYEGPEPTGECLNCGALVYGAETFCNSNCTSDFTLTIEDTLRAYRNGFNLLRADEVSDGLHD